MMQELNSRIIVVGANGQDGRLLVKKLLDSRDAKVFGITRNNNIVFNELSVNRNNFALIKIDIQNLYSIEHVVREVKPHIVFFLAAINSSNQEMNSLWQEERQSLMYEVHVQLPELFMMAIRKFSPHTTFVYCGSSKMFDGYEHPVVVNEATQSNAKSIYGITKSLGRQKTIEFREQYGVRSKCAILFNHESELRAKGFLFQKIAHYIREEMKNTLLKLNLENPGISGDWHSARDTIEGLILLAEAVDLDEIVLGSGVLRPISGIVDEYLRSHSYSARFDDLIYSSGISPQSSETFLKSDIRLANSKGWYPRESLVQVLCRMVGCH